MAARSSDELIAPPAGRRQPSLFSRVATPLNITLLALLTLLLPEIGHDLAETAFFLTRPLLIVLVVIAVATIVSLLVIAAGTLSGLRLQFLSLGPVQVYSDPVSGMSARVNHRWRRFIGSVLLIPRTGSLSRSQAVAVSGTGVLASLALSFLGISYALDRGWPGIDDPNLGDRAEALILALPVGLVIVLLGELLTGAMILSPLLRGSPAEQRRMLAGMTIASWMAVGVRPRDWEPGLIEQATSVPDTSADHLMGLCFAYLHAVDQEDLARAQQYLNLFEQWLRESSVAVRPMVLSSLSSYASLYHERAWLTAALEQDLDKASEYLNRAAGYQVADAIDLRVKAQILALEGDHESARVAAMVAEARLEDMTFEERWRVPFERDLLRRILND